MLCKINMRNVLFLLLSLGSLNVYSQDKIEAERPNESITPKTLSRNTFQAEFGVRRTRSDEDDKVWRHPNALLRFGLLDKLELRLESSFENQRLYSENKIRKGLRPVEVGMKVNIIETKNEAFSSSIVGQVGIANLASADHKTETPYHRVRLLFENKLSEKLKLNYNVGSDWDSEDQEQNWVYSFAPELELSEKWEAFVEVFGFVKNDKTPENLFDAGFSFFPIKSIKIDASGGVGLNSESPRYFAAVGFSFRIGSK